MNDRARYFQIAHGSALECAAALDVLVARNRIEAGQAGDGKALLEPIVAMLLGLLNHHGVRFEGTTSTRVREGEGDEEGEGENLP